MDDYYNSKSTLEESCLWCGGTLMPLQISSSSQVDPVLRQESSGTDVTV